MKYVSILRGINIGGHKSIKMADLRALYESLGFSGIESYIQSGNVAFTSTGGGRKAQINLIEAEIEETFGFHVPVLLRTRRELERTIENNPFTDLNMDDNETTVLVTFLSDKSTHQNVAKLQDSVRAPDRLSVLDKETYSYCPNGYAKSNLSNNLVEQKLGVDATTRNWKSVLKLYEMSC
ncbi:MAG: DUF1697 domain-containing protein [Candidatus Hydrogenedentota bacterium]